MSDTPNFESSFFDESPDHVERPKAVPAGTYRAVVGNPRYDKSSKKGTPFVEFPLRLVEALDDVDPDDLAEAGGLDGKVIMDTYYATENSGYRLDQFHENCGIDLSQRIKRSVRNDMCVNADLLVVVKHEQSQDGTMTYAKIARTAPIE